MNTAYLLLFMLAALLIIFSFYAFFKYLYAFASLFPVTLPHTRPSGKQCAVVIVAFNEEHVVEETVKACDNLTYQRKLIVLADDSTDPRIVEDRRELARARGCELLEGHGFSDQRLDDASAPEEIDMEIWEGPDFVLLHRPFNTGFKAGSLQRVHDYLDRKGIEIMYLLDADWHPQPDALEKTFSVLEADDRLAFVQTKRIVRRDGRNLFQKIVTILEEACYFADFQGRQALGHPILFSGCCALLRLDALRSVGGFKSGHLTEDLDLTNRLWLGGWKGAYAGDVVNSGEVPFLYDHFRRQQERWATGSTACMREYFGAIVRSRSLRHIHKFSAIRQNAYFFGNVFTAVALITALVTISWVLVRWNSYNVEYFLFAAGTYQLPISLILFLCFFSVLVGPLIMICVHKRRYSDLVYLPMAVWYAWSISYTYLIGNARGFFRIPTNWFRTPKLKRSATLRSSRTPMHLRMVSALTLSVFVVLYSVEGLLFNYLDVFALVWIPSMWIASFE